MYKRFALVLVLVFLTASCVIVAKPVSGASAVENSWVSKAPMHVARSDLGIASVNGKIYAIGGTTQSGMWPYQSGGIVGINEEYDTATDTWMTETPMPTPRMDFATAVYQNKIYCIGGIASISINGEVLTAANEVYDPATYTWKNKTSMPTAASNIEANVVNDKIYIFDGTTNWVYDPVNDTWTTKATMPIAGAVASGVFNNKIYVIGSSTTQIYDPTTDTWSLGAPPPALSPGSIGVTTGIMAPKRIYFIGGYFSNSYSSETQVYDLETDSWASGAAIPTQRGDFAVAVVNDTIYVIGGGSANYPNIMSWSTGPDVTKYATNEQYIPFGYGTVPPVASIVAPENITYNESSVPLAFTLSKSASWLGYSLDGKDNVTIAGNTSLAGLSNGVHNVTVYAKDNNSNVGASETITFTITSATFPTARVAAISGASAVVVIAGLLVYFKKRKR